MAELKRMIYRTLATDTVDTSSSNPSLLTLANRSPQRQQSARGAAALIGSTTWTNPTLASVSSGVVGNTTNFAPGDWLCIQDPPAAGALVGTGNFEVAQIAPGGVSGLTLTFTAPLLLPHAAGALVTELPTIITDHESREVITDISAYWRIVVGPYREVHDPSITFRTPTRLYNAFCWVKVYDSSPSHKLAEDVMERLDFLLNLGESSAVQALGSSPNVYVEKSEIVEKPDPSHESGTLVHQIPVLFRFVFQKLYT